MVLYTSTATPLWSARLNRHCVGQTAAAPFADTPVDPALVRVMVMT
jgi:hypothetical protein